MHTKQNSEITKELEAICDEQWQWQIRNTKCKEKLISKELVVISLNFITNWKNSWDSFSLCRDECRLFSLVCIYYFSSSEVHNFGVNESCMEKQ